MLSLVPLVVASLSTDQKLAIAGVGAAFVTFALVSALVIPRRRPDFPRPHLGWYVVVCVLFFIAMISTIVVVGREASAAETSSETTSTATTTTTSSTPAPTTTTGGATQGDPVAGKAVFTSAGCTGCHTLQAAGSTGTVGPNLDTLKPAYDTIVHQVENGGGAMPSFKSSLTPTQIHDVAAFVYTSTHS